MAADVMALADPTPDRSAELTCQATHAEERCSGIKSLEQIEQQIDLALNLVRVGQLRSTKVITQFLPAIVLEVDCHRETASSVLSALFVPLRRAAGQGRTGAIGAVLSAIIVLLKVEEEQRHIR
jgi:hypothetical protein